MNTLLQIIKDSLTCIQVLIRYSIRLDENRTKKLCRDVCVYKIQIPALGSQLPIDGNLFSSATVGFFSMWQFVLAFATILEKLILAVWSAWDITYPHVRTVVPSPTPSSRHSTHLDLIPRKGRANHHIPEQTLLTFTGLGYREVHCKNQNLKLLICVIFLINWTKNIDLHYKPKKVLHPLTLLSLLCEVGLNT